MAEKHGYETIPVADIRKEIQADFPNETTDEILAFSKGKLIPLLIELKRKKAMGALDDNEPDDFASMEVEIEDDIVDHIGDAAEDEVADLATLEVEIDEEPEATPSHIPAFNSEGWSDYAKSQLLDDEKQDDHPKCDGLRRLVECLVGPILSKRISHIKCPTEMDRTATVAVVVEYEVKNATHPMFGVVLREEAVSDANIDNNNTEPFSTHMSAVAETRAEGRAFKRILRLKNVVSAEEVGQVDMIGVTSSRNNAIKSVQIEGIDRICQRTDINVLEFINLGDSGKTYKSITEVSSESAVNMLSILNGINADDKPKPGGVGSYDKNWRS